MDMSWQATLILSFALSFSSTVFAVKVLEDKGDLTAFYGRVAIVLQDLDCEDRTRKGQRKGQDEGGLPGQDRKSVV